MQQYGVVFTGQLCEGTRPEEARANLARLLRIEDTARLDRLFSGKPVVIKKGLDLEQARRYEAALRKAGVQCDLRRQAAPVAAPTAEAIAAEAIAAEPAPGRLKLNLEPLDPEPEAAPAPAPVARPGLSLEPLALAPVEEAPAPPAPASPSPASRPALPLPSATPAMRTSTPATASAATADEPAVRGIVVKGSGSGYGDSSITPEEIKGLCWGGFFMPWIWGGFNGVSISFAALPGLGILRRMLPGSILIGVSLLMSGFMLLKGRELAWQNKTWDSAEHFNRVQRRWTQGGLVFALVLMVAIPSYVAQEGKKEREMAAELARLEAEAKAEEEAAADDEAYAGETGDFGAYRDDANGGDASGTESGAPSGY